MKSHRPQYQKLAGDKFIKLPGVTPLVGTAPSRAPGANWFFDGRSSRVNGRDKTR